MEIFLQVDTWVALLTLTFLEIVLGVDNIIFISISANKLPENQRKKATLVGLSLAMITRIALLFSVSYLVALKDPIFTVDTTYLKAGVSVQSIILFLGGLFLLYKSTKEIREKMEESKQVEETKDQKTSTFKSVIFQIILIDIVFSFDSILTAVGMTNGVTGALTIMVIAVLVSMVIMMAFANPVNKFVSKNPTIQMLALSFLILIGFMLITESAHLSDTVIFNNSIGSVPKGYLYFAIAFSLGVEFLNMKITRNKKKVIEKLRRHSILVMICLLFIPATIQIVHAFEPHQEMICSSDVEHHFHQDELECTLCHLQAETLAILPKETFYFASKQIQLQNNRNYRFLFNHQQLSFSLRGPPIF